MIRIKKLEIEGFRGFPAKCKELEFSKPTTLIFGDNHQGKSSILNAIEWCFYGDQCYGAKSRIRERVGNWEPINRYANFASVNILIQAEEGNYTIKRLERRGEGKRGKSLEITLPDRSSKKEENAEIELSKLIGLNFIDFSTTVYQHQETIRDVVVQKPKEQSEAIDRLLGLSIFRDIGAAIKKADIRQFQREMAKRIDTIQSRIQQTLDIRQRDLNEKEKEAIEIGVEKKFLNQKGVLILAKDLSDAMDNFAKDIGLIPRTIILPMSWIEVASFINNEKEELDRLWSESPEVKNQVSLTTKRSEGLNLKSEIDECQKNLVNVNLQIKRYIDENGSEEIIGDQIKQIFDKTNIIVDQIKLLNPKSKLFEEGIAILRNVGADSTLSICPLCGQKFPNLLSHLEKEWNDKITQMTANLHDQENELTKQKSELEDKKYQLFNLNKNQKRLEADLQRVLVKIIDYLGKKISIDEDLSVLLDNEINSLSKKLEKINSSIKAKRENLNQVYKLIEKVNISFDTIKLKEKINEIGMIKKSSEYDKLEKLRDQIAKFIKDIETIGDLISEVTKEEAKSKLKTSGDEISSYFKKITNNPAIERLIIEVREGRSSGNEYQFCDQDGKELNPILSLGDLNALALSFFLGLIKTHPHQINFVIMDDPSQSLGQEQKKRLVSVLDDVCGAGKEIIIATTDSELRNFIETSLIKSKSIYEVTKWNPKTGAEIVKIK